MIEESNGLLVFRQPLGWAARLLLAGGGVFALSVPHELLIRPGVPLDAQAEDDLLWIRRPFLDDPRDHGALVVHGHTPVDRVTHYGNRLNIDTGAGYGRTLSAVVIEGDRVWLLGPGGRQPVLPGG